MVNNAGFGLVGPALQLDRNDAARHDRSQRTRAHRAVAGLHRQPGSPPRRHSQRRLARGFPARPGNGGVLRQQGVRAVVQRGAASRAGGARRAGHGAVPGTGGDRVPGARRAATPTIRACSRYPQGGWRASAIAASCAASAWWSPASPTGSWRRCCGSCPMGCCCRLPISARGACPAGPSRRYQPSTPVPLIPAPAAKRADEMGAALRLEFAGERDRNCARSAQFLQ